MNLVERWKEIYAEAVQLSDEIQGLPEACPCGTADAHLESRCACCAGHAVEAQRAGTTCKELLARLQADVMLFCTDFKPLLAPGGDAAERPRLEVRRGFFLAASDLDGLLRCIERVGESVVGFRKSCAMSAMGQVKQHGAALRAHCDHLNQDLLRGA